MESKQHGVNGVFLGGDWVPIEECADKFHIKNGSCKNDCSKCPRSRSKNSSAKADGSYDVIVIGSGCIGSAVARELSKTSNHVLLLEAADDVTQGATKGNSGIVHAGYDDTPGSVRAKFCWPGNQMFPQLDKELHFGYQRNGSLVLATNEEEVKHLYELKARGEKNGVKNLRVVEKEELFQLEPHVNSNCIAALQAPDAGNLIPYEYAIALAENAVDNGVELRIRRQVSSIDIVKSSADKDHFVVKAKYWEPKNYLDSLSNNGNNGNNNHSKSDDHMNNGNNNIKNNDKNKKKEKINKPIVIIYGIVIAILGVLITRNHEVARYLNITKELVWYTVYSIVIAVVLIEIIVEMKFRKKTTSALLSNNNNSNNNEKKSAPPSIGTGGEKISVEDMAVGGSGSKYVMNGEIVTIESYKATYVINCAGTYSDKIANMISDTSFKIKPRLGDYLLLNRNQGHLAKHTLFPCPGKLGKGVLVQTTLWGNLILGPTARDMHLPEVVAETNEDIQSYILSKCKMLVPSFDVKEVFHAFCGARAKSTRGDWIIEPSEKHPQFIHVAGIDSPGLAGSPAIAHYVVHELLAKAGLSMEPNPTFNPNRAPIITPKSGWKGLKAGPVGRVTNPTENVVCKCEKVTEAEIVTAIHRSLPIDSTQAIRKRTRAGMGFCQGDSDNYNCECRVADIIARETGYSVDSIGRRPWPATSTLPQRWITDEEKNKLEILMNENR